MADNEIIEAVAAYDKGKRTALGLKPGVVFLGAMPAATAAGHDLNEAPGRLFVQGYLDALDLRAPSVEVVTDAKNRIVRIGGEATPAHMMNEEI